MSTITTKKPAKRRTTSSRASLRINPQIKGIIQRAAKLQRVNFSEFMVRSSQIAAEAVLADRTRFVLPPHQWQQFFAALDSPPREIPALRRLFTEPSVFAPA